MFDDVLTVISDIYNPTTTKLLAEDARETPLLLVIVKELTKLGSKSLNSILLTLVAVDSDNW